MASPAPTDDLILLEDIIAHSRGMRNVKPRDLKVAEYQNPLLIHRVEQMKRRFNPALLGTITVNERDGVLFVVDGQHRQQTAIALKISTLKADYYVGLTFEQEAWLYWQLNDQANRRKPTRYQAFHARLYYGDPVASEINAIVEESGYKLSTSSSARGDVLACFEPIERIHARWGGPLLRQTLETLATIWKFDPIAVRGEFIAGMALLLRRYPGLPKEDLITKLSLTPAISVYQRHQARRAAYCLRGNSDKEFARVLLEIFNSGKRSRVLPDILDEQEAKAN